ncbi:hypothetical protein Pcinc_035474 [Petrolisthes cinctipes]|uniref:Uncharacterized protein n=1 Tax=Petrolisthes cinctipes TaxID=88211 RepID=A0AAE1BWJ6_PETCI|nr:hypothetical protein Pcinc_035474 [Petrolisthes cinctipes]
MERGGGMEENGREKRRRREGIVLGEEVIKERGRGNIRQVSPPQQHNTTRHNMHIQFSITIPQDRAQHPNAILHIINTMHLHVIHDITTRQHELTPQSPQHQNTIHTPPT